MAKGKNRSRGRFFYFYLRMSKFFSTFAPAKVLDKERTMDIALEIILLVIAWLCIVAGIIGCVVPAMPGVPLAYIGLIIAQFSDCVDFAWYTLVIWGFVTIGALLIDYVVPAWGAKQFGGTKWGMWGSTLGLLVGLFFGVWGVIIGPFVGAVVFELLGGKKVWESFKAGWGTFVGLLFSTIVKLICCGLMALVLLYGMIW